MIARLVLVVGALCAAATACAVPADPPPLTLAVTASAAEPAPWSPALADRTVVHAVRAVRPGGGVVSVVVGTNSTVTSVDLTPVRGNGEVEQDRDAARDKVEAAVPRLRAVLTGARPEAGGLDLLATYRRALRVSPPGATLVLVSSGVQTVDPLDVRALGWEFDVAAVVGDLTARGLVPDARGRHVEFHGLGVVYGTQPALPLPAAVKITALWQAVCVASRAASCTVLPDDLPLTTSAATEAVPVVPTDPTPTACQGNIIVPAAVTFAGDSDVLGPAADQVLAPVAAALARCPAGRVATFTGHTAQVPGGDTGEGLSLRRAEAVRARLARLGAPAAVLGPVVGAGCHRPIVDNMPGGRFSEPLASLNRRVEITVSERKG